MSSQRVLTLFKTHFKLVLNAFETRFEHIYIHTLYLDTVKISVTRKKFKIKTDLHVCRVGVRGGQLAIYLISKISKRSNGSVVRWKAVHFGVGIISGSIWGSFQGWGSFLGLYKAFPQMCPTVAENTFQKIGTRLSP